MEFFFHFPSVNHGPASGAPALRQTVARLALFFEMNLDAPVRGFTGRHHLKKDRVRIRHGVDEHRFGFGPEPDKRACHPVRPVNRDPEIGDTMAHRIQITGPAAGVTYHPQHAAT
jgi:hypothetical protein